MDAANTSGQVCICKSTRRLVHGGIEIMKQYVSPFCTLALLAGSLPGPSAQATQASQPVDPTAQAPATRAPATPPTFPTTKTKGQPDRPVATVFMGTIFKDGNAYLLRSGNEKYRLDSQKKAKNYEGKDVQITGTLDDDKKLIHVEKIKVSPAI
jgi:Protein of unknown function (DUF5818)